MTQEQATEEFKYRGERMDPLRNNKGTIEAKITDWYCSNEIRSNLGTAVAQKAKKTRMTVAIRVLTENM